MRANSQQLNQIFGRVKQVALLLLFTTACSQQFSLQETASTEPSASAKQSTTPKASIADQLYDNDLEAQQLLAAKVIADIQRGITANDFQTGSARFDGEWAVGSYQLAVLGLGQILLDHPELKPDYLPIMEKAVEHLVSPELNAFATEAWGEDGLTEAGLKSGNGHAYLGYTNLALSMLRLHKPRNRFAALNDRLTDVLVIRLKTSQHSIIDTYPNEAYPPDLAAVLGSVALHNQATKGERAPFLELMLERFQQNFVDPATGLVLQAVNADNGQPTDLPRASGTALVAYYLSFADPSLAQILFQPIAEQQQSRVMGMAGIKEYGPEQEGTGDIDSGELVMGVSPSATVFALAGARLTGDRALHHNLYNSIQLLGNSTLGEQNGMSLLESPLGNAMLLAMLTTPQPLASKPSAVHLIQHFASGAGESSL